MLKSYHNSLKNACSFVTRNPVIGHSVPSSPEKRDNLFSSEVFVREVPSHEGSLDIILSIAFDQTQPFQVPCH